MFEQTETVNQRRRRSASISLVLIASSVMVAGCGQHVSAGDVAYRDSFGSAEDCRRDYGDGCTAGNGGYHGPYILNSSRRPAPSSNSIGVEQTTLTADMAARINSGAEASRGGSTSRGGFGGEGGEGGGGE